MVIAGAVLVILSVFFCFGQSVREDPPPVWPLCWVPFSGATLGLIFLMIGWK